MLFRKTLVKLRGALPPSSSELEKRMDLIQEKLDNALFYIDAIKNSATVGMGEYEALTRIYTGQKIYVDTRDISVAPHLLHDGMWERGITKVWRDSISKGDSIVDIGANFGWFGIVAGANINDIEGIYFVEANPHLCPYIAKSCNINGFSKKYFIDNVAIADSSGKVELNFLEDYWGSSSINDLTNDAIEGYSRLKLREKIQVNALTLDDYLQKYGLLHKKCVVKIDIEGYEEKAIMNANKFLQSAKKGRIKLFLEFTASTYSNPSMFFEKLLKNFSKVSLITEHGNLVSINSYAQFLKKTSQSDDWAMLYCR